MITLQKLKWSNCFSYGADNELDLSSNTVTQVLGTNGMGKSSIPLIIEEALYNKNSKGIKKADIPNVKGNRGLYLRNMPHVGTREYSNFPLTLFGTEATNPSGKNADVDFKNFFKKSFYAGKLQNDPKLLQNLKRYLQYY